jgi:hypothetical protein
MLKTRPSFGGLEKRHRHRILCLGRLCSCRGAKAIRRTECEVEHGVADRARHSRIHRLRRRGWESCLFERLLARRPSGCPKRKGTFIANFTKAQVPNIAEMDRAGDVRLISHHDGEVRVTAGAVQRTRTQDYLGHEWCPGRPRVKPSVHYRLVLKTLGSSLNPYK